jgi:hypothetical protein
MRNGLTEERVRGAVGTVLVDWIRTGGIVMAGLTGEPGRGEVSVVILCDWIRAAGTIMKGLTGEPGGGEVSEKLSACIVKWDWNFLGNQGRDSEGCDGSATGCFSEGCGRGAGLSTIARLVDC